MISIGKDKLILDTANLAETDNVGAYLRDSLGALITSQVNGSQQALDVGINVAGVQIDPRQIRALTSADVVTSWIRDSVGASITLGQKTMANSVPVVISSDQSRVNTSDLADHLDGSAYSAGVHSGVFVLGVDNSGNYAKLNINAAGELLVAADLSVTSSFEKIEDSASANADVGAFILAVRQDTLVSSVSTDGDYAAVKLNSRGGLWSVPVGTVADNVADTENPSKVGSRARIGALVAVSADGNRADLLSDRYRRVWVNHAANVQALNQAVSVTTTAAALIATALLGRTNLLIQNLGSKAIYIGSSALVTDTNGIRIAAGADMTLEIGENVSLFAVAQSGTQDVRVFEIG